MQALSPRSANIQVKPGKKDQLEAKAAAVRKAQREREHPPQPPEEIREPNNTRGEPGHRYRTGKYLGKGGFAVCYEGELLDRQSRSTGQKYALKIVKSQMSQKKMEEKFRTELQIHSKMHNPNIVEFHRAFAFGDSTFVVLELCPNGSLMDMVKKRKFLTIPEVRRYVIQMCGAIKYMHQRDVIHRDLKMGNIFLDERMNVKIGDFGLAALLITEGEANCVRRSTLCGTPNYIAPEILEKNKEGHDYKVDIWSLGIIIFAMLTGFPPFQSKTQEEIYRKVKAREYDWPSQDRCANEVPLSARDLVAQLLVEAEERPSPDDIVGHVFFTRGMIPEQIPTSSVHTAPDWSSTDSRVSSAALWKTQWSSLCKDCGVGMMNKKQAYNNLGDISATTFKECRLEEKAGLTPVVPLPPDMVYRPFPPNESWPMLAMPSLKSDSLEITRTCSLNPAISTNARHPSVSFASSQYAEARKKEVHTRDPVPVTALPSIPSAKPKTLAISRSHAAVLRERARPNPTSLDMHLQTSAKLDIPVKAKPNSEVQKALDGGSGLLSEPPQRLQLNNKDSEWEKSRRPVNALPRSRTVSGRLNKVANGTSTRRELPQRSVSSVTLGAELRSEVRTLAQVPEGGRRTRSGAVKEGFKAKAKSEDVGKEQDLAEKPESVRGRSTAQHKPSEGSAPKGFRSVLIGPRESSVVLPNSFPAHVLRHLEVLEENLTRALANREADPFTALRAEEHPIVVKWVDYTNKFGIGYILNDGSIGCLFNADDQTPSTCIVVRKAERHVRRKDIVSYPDRHQIIPIQDAQSVEFFENRGPQGIKQKFVPPSDYKVVPGDGSASEKPGLGRNSYHGKRKKFLTLWRNFANYMVSALGKSEEDTIADPRGYEQDTSGPFIKFYQRFGDVGVWGFGDGSFQFNFPDHTKVVISEDGKHCDFYYLPIKAAVDLKRGIPVPPAMLDKRGCLSQPTQILLHGWRNLEEYDFQTIIEANHFESKADFIRKVVGIWARSGGIGCVPEGTRVSWKGHREQRMDGKEDKLVWVSIGAAGGDVPRFIQSG